MYIPYELKDIIYSFTNIYHPMAISWQVEYRKSIYPNKYTECINNINKEILKIVEKSTTSNTFMNKIVNFGDFWDRLPDLINEDELIDIYHIIG